MSKTGTEREKWETVNSREVYGTRRRNRMHGNGNVRIKLEEILGEKIFQP